MAVTRMEELVEQAGKTVFITVEVESVESGVDKKVWCLEP